MHDITFTFFSLVKVELAHVQMLGSSPRNTSYPSLQLSKQNFTGLNATAEQST